MVVLYGEYAETREFDTTTNSNVPFKSAVGVKANDGMPAMTVKAASVGRRMYHKYERGGEPTATHDRIDCWPSASTNVALYVTENDGGTGTAFTVISIELQSGPCS